MHRKGVMAVEIPGQRGAAWGGWDKTGHTKRECGNKMPEAMLVRKEG